MPNPLLFFVQFLLLGISSEAGAQQDALRLVIAAAKTEDACAHGLTFADNRWWTPPPGRSTSTEQHIRRPSPSYRFSGHVGWPVSNMPNPLLFFVQFLLLGISSEAGAQQDALRLVIAAAKTEDACAHGLTFADNRWWTPPPGRSTSTEQHIRRPSPSYRFSGHVGWPVSNMPNPLLFFVQFLLLGISSEAGAQQDALRLVIAAAKTEDACTHGPTFADNHWWTAPPGRSTSTEQHIRRPSQSYRFSGHLGWPVSNMPNPLLFFVQFLLLGISSEAGAQQDALRLVIAAAKTEDACAHGPTFADNRWWTPPPGRSTSTEQHIRRPSQSYRFSGHVGWPVSNMPNPLLFFVQFLLLGISSEAGAQQDALRLVIAAAKTEDACAHGLTFADNRWWTPPPGRSTSTEQHIRRPSPSYRFSGHVGWPVSNMPNPLLFFVQFLLLGISSEAGAQQDALRLVIAAAKTEDACTHGPTFADNHWWTAPPGRSTSTEQHIRRPSQSYRFSGHLGWPVSNMPNPLLFFVQFLLLGISSEAGAQQDALRLVIAAAKTEDACAHGPTFADNRWWTPPPGRSTSTEQHIRRPSPSYRFSGHVGWPVSNMPNPLLFFVQFLLLGISSEAGAQQDALRSVIAAAKTEDAGAHGPTFADNRWWTPPPGRSTSTEQHIRRPSPSYRFSGHVGWPVSNMPNPLLFFVQFLLLGISSEAGAQQDALRLVIAAAKTEDACAHGPTFADNRWWTPPPGRSTSTEQHLRRPSPSYHFSEHVGWPVSNMPNPLLFFVQWAFSHVSCQGLDHLLDTLLRRCRPLLCRKSDAGG
ncbi:uncharacterized protein LOC142796192 [Rhipicephalus microplus]|uniref:uncharacterized protein LOC142796192 n=1 Tax=Rhipicephalus microplus TaxID=6941 RepID=UPI003F6C5A3C